MTMHLTKRLNTALIAALVAIGLTGCATTASNPKDPFEGFNRAMFSVNEGLDVVVKPIAQGYDAAAPLRTPQPALLERVRGPDARHRLDPVGNSNRRVVHDVVVYAAAQPLRLFQYGRLLSGHQ